MSAAEEKIAALALALEDVDRHIRIVDASAKRNETNRLSMLHLHALAAVVIGPLFAGIGRDGMSSAIWTVARLIPGAPYTLGALIALGGLILGFATWKRWLFWEKVGLWILLLWYAMIAVSFGAAILLWWLDPAVTGPRPSLYAPAVYLHLCSIMTVHLVTLGRITRQRRSRS